MYEGFRIEFRRATKRRRLTGMERVNEICARCSAASLELRDVSQHTLPTAVKYGP